LCPSSFGQLANGETRIELGPSHLEGRRDGVAKQISPQWYRCSLIEKFAQGVEVPVYATVKALDSRNRKCEYSGLIPARLSKLESTATGRHLALKSPAAQRFGYRDKCTLVREHDKLQIGKRDA